MKTIDAHGSFEDAMSGSTEPVKRIATRLRDLIVDVYPDVVEVPWPKQKTIGYGVGPKKMSEHFCYIGAYTEHVNLGFYYGAALLDPEGILEGTGKNLRHVKVRDVEETSRKSLRKLIEMSLSERRNALGMEK